VFLCVDTLNGEGRDVCLTGERVPQTSQHTPRAHIQLFNFLSKSSKVFLVVSQVGSHDLYAATSAAQETFCLHPNKLRDQETSLNNWWCTSKWRPNNRYRVGGWVVEGVSASSGEENRIIFNPTCRRGDLQQVFMRWT
jgi:hypothetical protein